MKIIGLTKEYKFKGGSVTALDGVSFELPERGMVFILGKSGSGKTTLLNILAGLDTADGGEVLFRGQSLIKLDKSQSDFYRNTYCGFIFQEYNVLPELTVSENISLALEMQGQKNTAENVSAVLNKVELTGYEKRKINELSGGQRQRVAIARAIVKDPKIIFADEPTGALDSETGANILSILNELSSEKLVVVVTHDREFAEKYGDRIIELADGRVISDTAEGFISDEPDVPFEIKKTRLPIKTALKLGGSDFKHHPFRLLITVFLALVTFSAFMFSLSISTADGQNAVINSLAKAEWNAAILKKYSQDGLERHIFTEEELLSFNKYNSTFIGITEEEFKIDEKQNVTKIYDKISPFAAAYVTEQFFENQSFTYTGRFAAAENEIMITVLTAEQFIRAGVANSITALIDQNITVNNVKYTISAVIDTGYDSAEFSELKELTEITDPALYNLFYSTVYRTQHNLFYLSKAARQGEATYTSLLFSKDNLSKNQIADILNTQTQLSSYSIDNFVVTAANSSFNSVYNFKDFLFGMASVFGFFAVAMLIYFLTQNVTDKQETISVLRTLGAGKSAIFKIFLWESVLIGFVVLFLSSSVCALIFAILNGLFSAARGCTLVLFGLSATAILISFVTVTVCSLISCVIPLYKIMRIQT